MKSSNVSTTKFLLGYWTLQLIPNKAKKLPVFSVNGAAKQVSVIIALLVSIYFIQIMTRKIRLVALLPVIYICRNHGIRIETAVSVQPNNAYTIRNVTKLLMPVEEEKLLD